MLLIEHRSLKLPLRWGPNIYHVLRDGPFLGFKGLARGPALANRDDPFDGDSCFQH